MPTVSIIMASYNHERYIYEAIQSVFNQTYRDVELIIVDDHSTDNSVNIIKSFDDSRIKLTVLPTNQGQFVATNIGLSKASGKYIAILNSDDAYHPDKLAKQVHYLENNPKVAAVFTLADIIYEKKNPLHKNLYQTIFDQPNRNRYQWLNYFFHYGNCLCHPSVLLRRECHDQLGGYDPRFANCADYQFWIKLVAKHDIHIIQDKLTMFRILAKDGNMSGQSLASQKRLRWEDYQAKLLYFNNLLSEEDFFQAFPETNKFVIHSHSNTSINYLLARLALEKGDPYFDALGLRVLFEMVQDNSIAKELSENYDFSYKNLIELTSSCNPFQLNKSMLHSLKKRLGHLYHFAKKHIYHRKRPTEFI